MIFPSQLADVDEEIVKLEGYLDALEPTLPSVAPTPENPLGIDHFALLDAVAAKQDVDKVELLRHHLNGLRQFTTSQRYVAHLERELDRLKADGA